MYSDYDYSEKQMKVLNIASEAVDECLLRACH